MTIITYFSPTPMATELPQTFPSPFTSRPHAIAQRASQQLQQTLKTQQLWQHNFEATDGGKMFGVLVIKDKNDRIGFLCGYSGMLAGKWTLPGFVPPVFDQAALDVFLPAGEAQLQELTENIMALQESIEYCTLKNLHALLIENRELELTRLKQQHQTNKQLRYQQRSSLGQHLSSSKTTEHRENALALLSFESQQDKRERQTISTRWDIALTPIAKRLSEFAQQLDCLKRERARLSGLLHKKVFSTYRLCNSLGEYRLLTDFFNNQKPPGGTGDCAAPKLIQYAHKHQLEPIALAEFWWGASPAQGIRHHRQYYPACRGKCHPILPFMLAGQTVQQTPPYGSEASHDELITVYEDNELLVINKPAGLLSAPGREVSDSVYTRIKQYLPNATGPLLVHRLDMATSGLLLIAKNSVSHKALQRQFIQRHIEKRYIAILSKRLAEDAHWQNGKIELPLRVDLDDRPRQIVCFKHGKSATTHWQVIDRTHNTTRVYFYPLTGRTHQLRVHAAHQDGLNAPIIGDALYGTPDVRLMLHAERLRFIHPLSGKEIEVRQVAPF